MHADLKFAGIKKNGNSIAKHLYISSLFVIAKKS